MVELCRICLNTRATIPLFNRDTDEESSQMHFKLMSCTSVQVLDNDTMPQLLCSSCAERLDDAYRLKEQALKTDAHLKHRMGVVKIEYSSKWDHKTNEMEAIAGFSTENDEGDQSSESNLDNEMTDSYEDVKFSMNDESDSKDIPFLRETIEKISKSTPATTLSIDDRPRIEQSKNDDHHESKFSVQISTNSVTPVYEMNNENTKVSQESNGKIMEIYIKRCQLCPEIFSSDQLHKVHMEEYHPYFKKTIKQKTIMCDTCGKSLASPCALKLHMLVHTGEKPFICTICKKGFVNAGNLRKHVIAVHNKDRPYHCKLCPARFGDSSTRRRHHIKEHTENLDNVCNICKKPFVTASKLIRHRLTHLKPRSNICNVCSLTFARRFDLVDHIKRVHLEVPLEKVDDYCGKVPVK